MTTHLTENFPSRRARDGKGIGKKESLVVRKYNSCPVPRSLAQRLIEIEAISFSWENRNGFWFGLPLTFNSSQRTAFKVLWDNFCRGNNLPIPNERIMSGVIGETTHIYHLFKRHDARIFGVFVGDGKGYFWLRLPEKAASLTLESNLEFLDARRQLLSSASESDRPFDDLNPSNSLP